MSAVHLLNVGPGDCTVIQHASGRVSLLDICCANAQRTHARVSMAKIFESVAAGGNFRMCDSKEQPLDYLQRLGVSRIWRFILSHPDMDHMDGLAALLDNISVQHFWDSGVRRAAPDFAPGSPYLQADWDAYEALISGSGSSMGAPVQTLEVLAGNRFSFANEPPDSHDGIYILAPDKSLRDQASASEDVNDGSYALLYRSNGGRIVLPGDAYDDTWRHVIDTYRTDVAGCAFLLAPHHGRDSARSYEYLDVLRPALTLIGCAPSEHINYHAWYDRGLDFITSNQAGNVVLHTDNGRLNVFIENRKFAAKYVDVDSTPKDALGHYFIGSISDR
ncbi:MAG: hypothetical protein KF689_08600 [Gemmatimonadaceae bacterium]|nr:hypothetical protein [Gemmatimonadaceae bacterium]MCW5827343.1 hypothetical protein [Gemmatimonadaceae bacterium]